MYTPAQTAQMLGIGITTLRKYAREFGNYLSPSANRSSRKYTESDIAILSKIVQLRAEGVSIKEIPDKLGIVSPISHDQALALIPTISAEFEDIRARYSNLDDRVNRLSAELEELKAQQKRTWLQRLFGKK